MLGNYQVRQLIRESQSGRVYLAQHTGTGLDVEIKVLPPAASRDPQLQKRIEREVATLMKLSHPHIVRIWAIGRQDDVQYLVMEHVQGRTLESWLSEVGCFPLDDSLNLSATLLSALAAAHAMKIVHRDICPANILLGDDGRVVISDFGFARFVGSEGGSMGTGYHASELASNAYKAPEQMNSQVDFRSDIYAVGCVLYHCISGQLPFDGSPMQQLIARMNSEPKPLIERKPDISPMVNMVIMRFLEAEPDNRWQEAQAALQGIEALL